MPERVVDSLRAIESPGAFSVRVTAPAGDLRIEVKDVGPIRLPVSSRMARKLVGVARPAPFGRGERTVRDPQVRDTWEIARGRVKVDQRLWRQTLDPQLERIKAGLGLPQDCQLKARLHKLLVYEPGQFFRVHQDSEKSDDMVGTLSVVLPSTYTGGAEVIEHRSEKVTYRRTARSGKALTLIAFYADCHHEIRPVKSGYRVVLVYNLSVRRAKGAVTDPIDGNAIDNLAASVRHHFDTAVREYSWQEPARPEKLVYRGRPWRTHATLFAPCCRSGAMRPQPAGPSSCSRGPSRWPASSPMRSWRQACCSRCRRQIFPEPQCPGSPI
jgi:predicted 2-oxoglutarate/Fe(II)-dependent dioxygenase YbiX